MQNSIRIVLSSGSNKNLVAMFAEVSSRLSEKEKQRAPSVQTQG